MFRRDQKVYFKGERISISDLIKEIKPREKYLAIVTNKEEIIAEAKRYFRDFKVLIQIHQQTFPISQPALEMIIKQITQTITMQTHQNDLIVFVFSAPCILLALLAKKFSKSSRHILFTQYDFYRKIYHLYEIDKPT